MESLIVRLCMQWESTGIVAFPSGVGSHTGTTYMPYSDVTVVTQAWATLQPKSSNQIGLGANVQSINEQWFPVYVTINGAMCNIIRG